MDLEKEGIEEAEETPEQKTIRELREENERLKNRKIETIQKIIYREPDDYQALRKNFKRLQDNYDKLKQLIAFGNINTLDYLIDEYTSKSRSMLKRISVEIQLTNYDSSQIKKISDLIDYLEYVSEELASFISIHEEGKFVLSPKLRACNMSAKKICKRLGKKNALAPIPKERLEDFQEVLENFQSVLDSFMNPPKNG